MGSRHGCCCVELRYLSTLRVCVCLSAFLTLSLSLASHPLTNSVDAVIHMQESPPQKRFLVGCSSPFMRLTQHLTVLRAWCNVFLVGAKPDVLSPGIVGMRGPLWSYGYDYAWHEYTLPPSCPRATPVAMGF